MRQIPKHVYESEAFQEALKVRLLSATLAELNTNKLQMSGLLDCLYDICEAGNLLETTHPDVELSFRYHNWKITYGELLTKWIPPSISAEEYEEVSSLSTNLAGIHASMQRRPKPKADYQFSEAEALELLKFVSSKPRMHPWGHNPMAVYLFLSLHCFVFNSETWLEPCLRRLNYSVSTFSACTAGAPD